LVSIAAFFLGLFCRGIGGRKTDCGQQNKRRQRRESSVEIHVLEMKKK
jgi:hypothetical protein